MPTNAGGTGAIGSDCLGNHVTELASSRNSHGGGRCFAGSSSRSAEGCFSCGGLTHTMDQCRTLDESFPFLPTGWQAEHIGDQFILGTADAYPLVAVESATARVSGLHLVPARLTMALARLNWMT